MIDITGKKLFERIKDSDIEKVCRSLEEGENSISLSGLRGSSKYYLTNLISHSLKRPYLYIFSSQSDHGQIIKSLNFYNRDETVFFDKKSAFKKSLIGTAGEHHRYLRLDTLVSLLDSVSVCAAAATLFEIVIPTQLLSKSKIQLSVNDRPGRDEFIDRLSGLGYIPGEFVVAPCQSSVRGSIVDLFSPGHTHPIRIEFEGDRVRSLRYFLLESQKSLEKIDNATIYAASEYLAGHKTENLKEEISGIANERGIPATKKNNFLNMIDEKLYSDELEHIVPLAYDQQQTVLNYLGDDYLLFLDLANDLETEFESASRMFEKNRENTLKSYKFLPEFDQGHISVEELDKRIKKYQTVNFNDLVTGTKNHFKINTENSILGSSETKTPVKNLADKINNLLKKDYEIFIVSYNENERDKLRELLSNYEIDNINYLVGQIDSGFISADIKLAVFSEHDFSEKDSSVHYEYTSNSASAFLSNFSELKTGDYIVHKKFGIGIYNGLKKLKIGKNEGDFIECEYRDNDKVFVPVENLKLVQRYIGDNKKPRVDKLGSETWKKTVRKVKKAVESIARELLDLYAKRKAIKGFSFSGRDQVFNEFEMDFPFEETPDQAKSIEEVISDMELPKPMDRLICGDVGFGKTEIALRAAFKAAMDGRQVAFLVPTTLLANQHYDTFKSRLRNYPVNTEMLSRFRTAGESKKIVQQLEDGFIDIIIGTHKLLGEKVRFKNLGLLIIDEEHKFGVRHKERLRLISEGVDVLSLSATPIPRSLQLSLASIRDISLVNTPPEGRMPVDVYINNYGSDIIRDAVMNELERDGLVFFINNRIENIFEIAEYLKTLVPEASIGVTHGRMREKALEDCISRFIDEKINLLVTTAIVESGLDIPKANTIIVNDAHKFGLADLYQLKGRVGRGRLKAYAYFLVPSVNKLTHDATKRLTKLSELQELGSGFKLAMSDLEIRGAGNLFGEEQSGTISDVGLELYLEMLQKAVNKVVMSDDLEDFEPEIKNYESAFIPEHYITDNSERLYYYKKLSSFSRLKELKEIKNEITDRFGKMPGELKNLTKILEFKFKMKKLRISKIEIKKEHSLFVFKNDSALYEKFKPSGKLKIYYDEDKSLTEIDKKLSQLNSDFYH